MLAWLAFVINVIRSHGTHEQGRQQSQKKVTTQRKAGLSFHFRNLKSSSNLVCQATLDSGIRTPQVQTSS